jgi:site-specific DNA-adenine methylase
MANYATLKINHFYLVIENEGEDIVLIQPLMETENCILIEHHDDYESTFWRKKTNDVFEVIEELTEEQVVIYQNLFEEEEEDEEWYEELNSETFIEEDEDYTEEIKEK